MFESLVMCSIRIPVILEIYIYSVDDLEVRNVQYLVIISVFYLLCTICVRWLCRTSIKQPTILLLRCLVPLRCHALCMLNTSEFYPLTRETFLILSTIFPSLVAAHTSVLKLVLDDILTTWFIVCKLNCMLVMIIERNTAHLMLNSNKSINEGQPVVQKWVV